ncbi:hypothetical protein DO73_4433 [Burkholderia pseudomallei]|nr:hypothetical protein DO73_4433 [Burkholderia pseudomallei]
MRQRVALQREARRARERAAAADELLAQLDALDEVRARIEVQERHEPAIQRERLVEALLLREAKQRLAFLRERVGHAGHPALRANGDALDDDVVEAREQHEAIADRVAQVDEAARVARRILEADDVLAVLQRDQHVGRHVVPVDRRVVVDHHRQIGARRDRAKVRGRLVRLRGVDERGHHHHAVHAHALRLAHGVARELGRELRDAGDHGHLAARRVARRFDHRELLGRAERRVLAHRAADDEARHAVVHQVLHDAVRRVDIEGEIRLELGADGGEDPAPLNRVTAH